VTSSRQEVEEGDRLLPAFATEKDNHVPHPPDHSVSGHVVSIYGGVALAGTNQTVAINLGAMDGINKGTVLPLYRADKVVDDGVSGKSVRLPSEEYGALYVYRVFDRVSYGLIMDANDSTSIGDIVVSPL
jgi:hypothetical protein